MTDKIQAVRTPRFGFDPNSPLVRCWRWWVGELAAQVQQWMRPPGENAAAALLLEVSPQFIVMRRWQQGNLAEQGNISLQAGDLAANGIAFQSLFGRVHRQGETVALQLAQDQYLAKQIELPLAAQENLSQVLAFEIDRHTPFKSEQVYFGFRTLHQDHAKKRLTVRLIVAPRAQVDGPIEMLRRWGVAVQAAYVHAPASPEDGAINLMPNARRSAESPSLRKLNLYLFLLALFLGLSAILLPIWQKRKASIELIPVLERAKQQALETEDLRHEQERLAGQYNFMLNKKQEVPPTLVVLDELSSLLPDDTWVQQLTVKGKEVQIQGETNSSAKLISLIESSRIFHDSSFRSPLTKGGTPNSERYQIVAETKPLTVAELRAWPPASVTASQPAAATAARVPGATADLPAGKPAANAPAAAADKVKPVEPPHAAAATQQPALPVEPVDNPAHPAP